VQTFVGFIYIFWIDVTILLLIICLFAFGGYKLAKKIVK